MPYPIICPLPPSFAEQRTQVSTALASSRAELRMQKAALVDALRSVSNTCTAVQSGITSHVVEARSLPAYRRLSADVDAASRQCKEGLPLRMKADPAANGGVRIVPLASRSMLKNLLGIGTARRAEQAQALAVRHGMAGQAAVTRLTLSTALHRAEKKMEMTAVADTLARHAVAVNGALADAVRIAVGERGDEAGVAASCRLLFDSLNASVSASDFTLAVDDARQSIRMMQRPSVVLAGQMVTDLERQLHAIDTGIKEGERQQKVAARSRAAGHRNAPVQSFSDEQKVLAQLRADCEFDTIFHTTVGRRQIQKMFDGCASGVSGSAVINEIRERHGDDIFDKGARQFKQGIKSGADALTPARLHAIDRQAYATAYAGYREARVDFRTMHRQADHSLAMIETLRGMVGTQRLLQPARFLSTSDSALTVRTDPVVRQAGLHPVRFTLEGFSGMQTGSRWRFAGEPAERLFGTQARFLVQSVTKGRGGAWDIRLREVPVGLDAEAGTPLQV